MNKFSDVKHPRVVYALEGEIERLRDHRDALQDQIEGAYDELERLRSLNAELVAALKEIATHRIDSELASKEKRSMALNALSKVKGIA